jgi:hypothetical protein
MSHETTTTAIRDNHFCGSVGDVLRPHLKTGANLSVVSAKEKNPEADTNALERETDQQVYAFYGLTPEEIKIVEAASV